MTLAPDPLHRSGLGDVLREHRRSRPHHLAVVDGDVRLTFRALDDRVNRLVHVLAGCGVGSGSVVAWYGQGSHRVLEALLAAAKLGARLCPLNWRASLDEVTAILADLEPTVVLWQKGELGELAVSARAACATPTWIGHDDDGADGYEFLLSSAADADPDGVVDPATPLMVLYTAAFEGRPHGALLSHDALLHQALVIGPVARLDDTSVFLNSGPLFHIATWMWSLPTFVLGGTNVYVRRPEAEELCRLIDAERCTNAFLMPPTIDQMAELNAAGSYDLTSLRAPARSAAWDAMVTVDPSPMGQRRGGYGQTEVTGLATMAAYSSAAIGGAGRPAPLVQARIVDPEGSELPPGEVGEIVVRGPTVTAGFHRDEEFTARRLRGGWLHTNDLGRREDDGSVTFVGPMARLIKSAAENVYPAEVEGCIREHELVVDCAVIGVPDPVWSQRVKALVVRTDETLDEQAVIEHCRAHIASYKKPSIVEFVDSLPRHGGLVDYDALDAAHGGGGYPGAGT